MYSEAVLGICILVALAIGFAVGVCAHMAYSTSGSRRKREQEAKAARDAQSYALAVEAAKGLPFFENDDEAEKPAIESAFKLPIGIADGSSLLPLTATVETVYDVTEDSTIVVGWATTASFDVYNEMVAASKVPPTQVDLGLEQEFEDIDVADAFPEDEVTVKTEASAELKHDALGVDDGAPETEGATQLDATPEGDGWTMVALGAARADSALTSSVPPALPTFTDAALTEFANSLDALFPAAVTTANALNDNAGDAASAAQG